ncbi:response regulator transcription factor [Marinilactibacillus psychrotolerans]|uniref:response regulator transcription factor n=1 Tax=Marinilactibacillus psychrotolerans TaxID=191770 RepID=UPI001869331D|nr:response regulator transcription factor [Marinilactibacillus psychrotolerans]
MDIINVLIADDDQGIADLLAIHLKKEGYTIYKAANGKEALHLIKTNSIDLLILDIMMPEMDGYEAINRIRKNYNMPIIFLSAKTSDFDKVHGLAIGADDYMTKPFTPIELVARVNAQLRRYTKLNYPIESASTDIEHRGLIISQDYRTVTLYDTSINLTPKEFDILYLLASHPKKVFSVENIFKHVWKEAYFDDANTVMVHIRTLRKKLKEDQQKDKWIKTVWGVGYAFNG